MLGIDCGVIVKRERGLQAMRWHVENKRPYVPTTFVALYAATQP